MAPSVCYGSEITAEGDDVVGTIGPNSSMFLLGVLQTGALSTTDELPEFLGIAPEADDLYEGFVVDLAGCLSRFLKLRSLCKMQKLRFKGQSAWHSGVFRFVFDHFSCIFPIPDTLTL